jgi:hypothetical protein
MNEYLIELVNGWGWVYADDYHLQPATTTHAARYVFTRGMRTVETMEEKKVMSITKNPPTIQEIKA